MSIEIEYGVSARSSAEALVNSNLMTYEEFESSIQKLVKNPLCGRWNRASGFYQIKVNNKVKLLYQYKDNKVTVDGVQRQYAAGEIVRALSHNPNYQRKLLQVYILNNKPEALNQYFEAGENGDYIEQIRQIQIIMEHVLGSVSKTELGSFYKTWIRFDKILNIVGVRDHIIHDFETFLLGCEIINLLRTRDIVRDYHDIMFKWILASTLHDVGYPVEKFLKVKADLAKYYLELGMKSIQEAIEEVTPSDDLIKKDLYCVNLGNEQQEINLRELFIRALQDNFKIAEREAEEAISWLESSFQHGLVGASFILRNILKAKRRRYIGTDSYHALMGSIGSILVHHYIGTPKAVLKQVSATDHLITALLIICDELQEWNRPIEDLGILEDQRRHSFTLGSIDTAGITDNGKLKINIIVNRGNNDSVETEQKILDTLEEKRRRFDCIMPIVSKNNQKLDIILRVEMDNREVGVINKELII